MKIKDRTLICQNCKKETKMNAAMQKYCSPCNSIVNRRAYSNKLKVKNDN